jgi:hypothetical protein
MTQAELRIRMLWAWASSQAEGRRAAMREQDPERGDGLLVWVIMVAALAAAAIIIVAIIVNKAQTKANDVQTQ